jgi:DNA-binding MarR family transcriptional regulator
MKTGDDMEDEIIGQEILARDSVFRRHLRADVLQAIVLAAPELTHGEYRLLTYLVSRLPQSCGRTDHLVVHCPIAVVTAYTGLTPSYVPALKRRLQESGWLTLVRGSSVDLSPTVRRLPEMHRRIEGIWELIHLAGHARKNGPASQQQAGQNWVTDDLVQV